jgi:hypothetical protein
MINLLPAQYKKQIAREVNWKIFMILGLLVLLFLLSLSLILFSIKTYISSQTKVQEILQETEEAQFKESGMQETEKEIGLINEELFQLHSFYKSQFQPSDFLQKLTATLSTESYFTVINFKYLS